MASTNTWLNVDKTAFRENAILLELKNRAQGRLFRADSCNEVGDAASATSGVHPYATENLLDDLALIVAGPGGRENVTAACLEVESVFDSDRTLVVRVAKNGGTPSFFVEEMQKFCDLVVSGESNLS